MCGDAQRLLGIALALVVSTCVVVEAAVRASNRPRSQTSACRFLYPALSPGAQQFTLANPDGESVSLDAAFLAQ